MASAWTRQRSQGFGPTSEALDGPYQGYAHFNKGIDFAAPAGDSVESMAAGTVIAVGNQGDGWGFSVKVKDAQGNVHNYGHLDPSIPVQVGQQVGRGQVIGAVGAKIEGEASTGSHLSYDVRNAAGEFFDPESFVSGGSAGGSTVTQPSATAGRYYKDPELDSTYQQLRDAFLDAQKKWTAAGHAQEGPQFDAYQEAMFDFQDFTDNFGHPTSSANDADPAQTEFENRIKLGDYEGRQADRGFQQWYDKYSAAQTEASNDFSQRSQHNADLAANAKARETSQTPSQLPRNTDRGYIEQSRSELMDAYLKKLGVGYDAPAPSGSGLQTPGQATPAATDTGTPWSEEPNPFRSAATSGRPLTLGGTGLPNQNPPPANPWDQRTGDQAKNSSNLLDRFGWGVSIPGTPVGVGVSARTIGSTAKSAGKAAKRWWQRGFAEGGRNIPAQRAWVGEKGPEMMEVPGFGSKIVGQNGPEEADIPEGANIIPMDEAFAMQQIKQAARQGIQPDIAMQNQQSQQRANDPELRAKVMASLKKAMASNLIANPPYTPILENPAIQRDIWAANRQITGVPVSAEEAAMQQQAAAKGAKRG